MSEQSFREIQLSGKQLVFLFMASVVVAVSIFLLGISVGRGLRPGTTVAVGTTAVDLAPEKDQSAPAVMPPPTEVTPADRAYHDQLQGQVTPPAAALPSLAAASGNDAATAPPEPVGDGATTGTETKSPTPAATKTVKMPPTSTTTSVPAATGKSVVPPGTAAAPASTTDASKPAPSGGGWFVQVGAFKSRDNADRLAARLKAKGYAAAVLVTSSKSVPFHVRVGPLGDRSEAQRAAARIEREEGQKPSVTH